MAIYGYIRVSTSTQLEGYGLEQQRALLKKHYPDIVIFEDDGISGTRLDRPALVELFEALRPGDSVVVRELSRLWRCDWVASEIKHRFIEGGIKLVDLSDPGYQLDPHDPTVFLFQHIKEGLASFERMQITQKLAAARAQKRAQGFYACGKAPLGYKWEIMPGSHHHKHLVIDEPTAAKIRDIYADRAHGLSYQKIADKHGLKGRNAALYIVKNSLYKGDGAPAIVSKNLWTRANKTK